MSIVDKIAAATGLSHLMNRQLVKQAGLAKESADVDPKVLAVKAPARDGKTSPVIVKDTAWAGRVLSNATEAIDQASTHLGEALNTAKQALTAPLNAQASMTVKFNALLHQAKTSLDNAKTENGLTLVGRHSKPMMAVSDVGGQVNVTDAGTGGIDTFGKATWLDRQAIQASVNLLETALITLSETRGQFAQAQYTLSLAAELHHGKAITDYRSRAGSAASVIEGAANAEWQAEAKRTVAEEANREAAVREAFARQMKK